MKYVLLSDLDSLEAFDDGLYGVKARLTPGSGEPATYEVFSENDLYRIRKSAPPKADALALTDDWVWWDSRTNAFYGYVFGGPKKPPPGEA
jgi:hypothetical protein